MFHDHFHIQFSTLFSLLASTDIVISTTEWFGDLRAHMNPPKFPPFYDIVYDEPDCPFGLESVAIPEFVYFGEMIATKFVQEHSQCLQFCLETSKCKAVNFFESMEKKNAEVGFCELLVEGQYDNPRLMRPFKKATYHEKIHCRIENEVEKQPFSFDDNEGKELLIGSESNERKNSSTTKQIGRETTENERNGTKKKTTAEEQRSEGTKNDHQSQRREDDQSEGRGNGSGKTDTNDKKGTARKTETQEKATESTTAQLNSLILKRLAERIQELKERFRN